MAWPLSQDYNEAVQNPLTSFADADLRRGRVVTNALGIPQPCTGNFADVYAIEAPGGRAKWAVKCFTREVKGLRERYAEISNYLQRAHLPFTVEFQYLEQGIRVGGRWYPILKMHWVEGFTLNAFVRDNLDRPAVLEALGRIWLRMAQRLREAHLAHADLQHGNVLLVPGSSAQSLAVKLIDYDGMWVPALARTPSGEIGHAAYQHPQRLRQGTYSAAVDRFPLLVIATALHCLRIGGRPLWQRFDTGDNLLFRESDFQAPVKSLLFYELLKLPDPLAHKLVEHTLNALKGPLEAVPPLEELLPEAPTAAAVQTAAATQTARAAGATAVAIPKSETGRFPRPQTLSDLALPTATSRPRSRRRRQKSKAGLVVAWVLLMLALFGGAVGYLAYRRANRPSKEPVAVRKERQPAKDAPPPKDKGRVKKDQGKKDPGGKEPGRRPGEKRKPPETKVPPVGEPKPGLTPKTGRMIVNAIGMRLVPIPAGTFTMGSSPAEFEQFLKAAGKMAAGFGKETPAHQVMITKPFYLGAYEVTQGQYEKVMGENPSKNKESPNHPVEMVTWNEAVAFCQKLSQLPQEKKAGRVYRLPTEAEWEYACRAGTTTRFHYGDTLTSRQANIAHQGSPPGKTVKAGSYEPNAWGLFNMHGNVWEWCLDGPRVYTADPVDDPRGPDSADSDRVLRGGSWVAGAESARSATRKLRKPSGYRTPHSGFRVLCTLSEPPLVKAPPPPTPQPPAPPPTDPASVKAEAALKPLREQLRKPDADLDALGRKLYAFRFEHPGTLAGYEAARLLAGLPSPLDKLSADKIPEPERFPWHPENLVAVLGEHRGRHGGIAHRVIYSSDGKTVVSGGTGLVHLWNADTLTLRGTPTLPDKIYTYAGAVLGLALSRDGKTLVVGGKLSDNAGSAQVWNVTDQAAPILRFTIASPGAQVAAVALHPDGKTLALGCTDGNIRFYNIAGEMAKPLSTFMAHAGGTFALAFTPDGALLASGGKDKKVRLWAQDGGKAKERAVLDGGGIVLALAISPDGKRLASGGDELFLRLWDLPVKPKARVRILKMMEGWVTALSFSKTGKRLAAACGGRQNANGTVELWTLDPAPGRHISLKGHVSFVWGVAFAPDGKRLVSSGQDLTVRSWDVSGAKPVERFKPLGHLGLVNAVAFTPNGKALISGGEDSTVLQWDLTGDLRRPRPLLAKGTAPIRAVACSPNGRTVAASDDNGTVRQWDVATGKPGPTLRHLTRVGALAYLPDSRRLLVMSGKELLLWDAVQVKILRRFKGHTTDVTSMALSPDGRRALSGDGAALRRWDVDKDAEPLLVKSPKALTGVAFAADGQHAFTGALAPPPQVRRWDLGGATPVESKPLLGEVLFAFRLLPTADGRRLAAFGMDGKLIVWDLSNDERLVNLPFPEFVGDIALSPEGRHAAVALGTGVVYVLRLAERGAEK